MSAATPSPAPVTPAFVGLVLATALPTLLAFNQTPAATLFNPQAWRQWQYDPPRISGSSPVATTEEKPRPRFWQQGWI